MTYMLIIKAAQELAETHGRDWADMGAYERQSYIDEILKQDEAND